MSEREEEESARPAAGFSEGDLRQLRNSGMGVVARSRQMATYDEVEEFIRTECSEFDFFC